MPRQHSLIVSLWTALLIAGCGGGGGGGGGIAGGGTSGTGTGSVSGFGSVIVNDIREFQINSSTSVTLDDDPSSQSGLKIGMVVNYQVGSDVNSTITAGTASRIDAYHEIKGPVTSINPLRVMGRTVNFTGDTRLDNITNINSIAVGNLLEVSGFSDGNGGVQATLLEGKSSIAQWKLIGTVANVNAAGFQIGTLTIHLNGLIPTNCGSGLQNGNTVLVKSTPDVDVASGGSLDTVLSVSCVRSGLSVPAGTSTTINAAAEGLISTLNTSARTFTINGQNVAYSSTTVFERGVEADLSLGAKVEAQGTLNATTGVLTATKIRFRQTQIKIEAPINDASVTVGQPKTLIGINVQITEATQADVMTGGHQVGVNGFVDKNGVVYATEWRNKGTQNNTDVRIEGPASNPIANSRFDILGATINVNANLVNPNVTVLFNAIAAGTAEVAVQHGQLTPPSTVSNADIRLK